jgi:hypothetical protein
LVCGFALVVSSLTGHREGRSILAGAVIGLATLLRGTTILLPTFFFPVAIKSRAHRWGVCIFAGFVLVVAPWSVRNLVVLKDPILVSVGIGSAIMQGSDERGFTIDDQHRHPGFIPIYAEAERAGITKPEGERESDIDRWQMRIGLYNYQRRLVEDPWSLFPFAAKKFLRLWYATETARLRTHVVLALCSLPVVLPGFLQLWSWKAKTPFTLTLTMIVAYFVLLHIITGPLNRYMLPVYPFLLLAASTWWVDLLDNAHAPARRLGMATF